MIYTIESEGFVPLETTAGNLAEAKKIGREYIQAADWGAIEPCYVDFTVKEANGATHNCKAAVNAVAKEPPCSEEKGHHWQQPLALVGGDEDEPGFRHIEGEQTEDTLVCENCGVYRRITSASAPGHEPRIPQCVAYDDPDEASLEWIGKTVTL